MEEEKNAVTYYLIIVFIIGCVFGYGIKSVAKNKVASGPDDKKIVVTKYNYDLAGAQKKVDDEMKKAEEEAAQAQMQAGQQAPTGQEMATPPQQ